MNERLTDEEIDAIWTPLPPQGDPTGRKFYRAFARAIESAVLARAAVPAVQPIPEGWKLVPVEPTEEMWTAGRDPIMYRDVKFHVPESMEAPPWRINPATGKVERDQSKGTTAVHVWRAMLAAAPQAPAVQPQEPTTRVNYAEPIRVCEIMDVACDLGCGRGPCNLAAPQAEARQEPLSLHPRTADLVDRFALALKEKLAAAERKYGYSDGWTTTEWMDECREHLRKHLEKGDPRDVAAYCAFLWHHGEPTAKPDSSYSAQPKGEEATERDAARYRSIRAALLSGGPEWNKLAAMLNIAPDTPAGVDDAVDAALSSTPAQGDDGGGVQPSDGGQQP